MSDHLTTTLHDDLALDRHGPAGGPAVVFVAGAGPWREIDPDTTRTAELLADSGVGALVHDRLGRGQSPADGAIGLARETAALVALVGAARADGGGPVVLVGHSSGAAIVLHAVAGGLDVDALLLWEAPLDPASVGVDEWLDEVETHLDAGRAEHAVATYMRDIPEEILADVRASPVWPAFVAQGESLRPDVEAMRWAYSAPLPALLAGVTVPVVVCHGEQTYPEMEASTAALTAALPRARAETVAGAHHTWDPAAMATTLTTLTRLP